ncbi:MAG: hypothetical protein HRU19_09885 [Pseudobacteriovorax sp.]|nr:hypothetical protein [Pseudobacteriovorax sp.]
MKKALILTIPTSLVIILFLYANYDSSHPSNKTLSKSKPNQESEFCSYNRVETNSIDYTSNGVLKVNSNNSSTDYFIKASGELQRTCLESSKGRIYHYSLTLSEIESNHLGSQDNIELMMEQLKNGVFSLTLPDDHSIMHHQKISESAVNIIRDVVRIFVHCNPNSPVDSNWECTENSQDQAYVASYESRKPTVRKSYSLADITNTNNSIVILHKLPMFSSSILTKTQLTKAGSYNYQGQIIIETKRKADQDLSAESIARYLDNFAKSKKFVSRTGQNQGAENSETAKVILGSNSFEDLSTSEEDQGSRFQKMRSWVTLNKERLEAISEFVSDDELSKTDKLWIQALSQNASYEALSTQLDIIKQLSEEGDKIFGQTALGMARASTPEIIDYLKHQKENGKTSSIKNNAVYSLGMIAARTNSNEVLEYLISLLYAAQTDKDIAVILRALGNTGHPGIATHIKPYYAHDNDDVREAALFASRFLPQTFPTLSQFLSDPRFSSSLAAARALQFFELTEAQTLAILNEWPQLGTIQVKSILVKGIGKSYKSYKSRRVRDKIEDTIHRESASNLKRSLSNIIESH